MTSARQAENKPTSVFRAVFRRGLLAGTLGGILFGVLLGILSYIGTDFPYWNNLDPVISVLLGLGVFGAIFGFGLGALLGFVDALILDWLVRTGARNPYESQKDRRVYCAVSAVITGGGMCFLISRFTDVWLHTLAAALIAAAGGWLVARQIFTRSAPDYEDTLA